MSLAADPNQTIEIVLQSDKNLPPETQPVFYFKYLTCRKWKAFLALREKMKDVKTVAEVVDVAIEILSLNLCGWKNVVAADGTKVEFSLDKIEDILSPDDIYDLMTVEKEQQTLSADDKKKLDSPSQSDTDSSAESAQV